MDSVSEHEDKFRAMAERRIREAQDSGEFKVDTGPDKQLDLEENPFVPEEWRLAFRVLKSGNYRPDWIELASDSREVHVTPAGTSGLKKVLGLT